MTALPQALETVATQLERGRIPASAVEDVRLAARVIANDGNHYDRYWEPTVETVTEEWLAAAEAKMRDALTDVYCDDAAAVMLTLIATIRSLSHTQEALRDLHSEVDCRIEHGAESGGHLEYVRSRLDTVLASVSPGQEAPCETCDGIGCPCFRIRDWQSMDEGCDHEGCPECGRNSCAHAALQGRERPPEHVFAAMRRMHGLPDSEREAGE